MNKIQRRWAGWGLSIAAVLLAGLLGGWAFREEPVEPDEPVPVVPQQPENRLAKESSPYLQLHKNNPVDWYPWGDEAFERARRENKPIFLSIGYSACYWCHVMERESFNDPEIAKLLNEAFVCIKLDREERPDIDEVYMSAAPLFQSRGGWPLSVFLTPDRKPMFIGTYYPPRDRPGMMGFLALLDKVVIAWGEQRAAVEAIADQAAEAMKQANRLRGSLRPLDRRLVRQAVEELAQEYDPEYGGFGFDPREPRRAKFPQPSNLELLLYHAKSASDERAKQMLTHTLDRMARGGVRDHVGGGFHRYSTDRFWRVPHFEKMLYDNAQLAQVYVAAHEFTGDRVYRAVAADIFRFMAREMLSPDGGFYSAIDAESEHEEGRFYVWSREEVRSVLDRGEFELFAAANGLIGPPNFEGRYSIQLVDELPKIAEQLGMHQGDLAGVLERAATKLLAARSKRTRPLTDDKIMTDWNGLAIAAFADGYRVLGSDDLLKIAERAADFILTRACDADGRLLHVYASGQAKLHAQLDDYAFLLHGLIALHRATKNPRWLEAARPIAEQMIAYHWDGAEGGFYRTPADADVVLVRIKPHRDSVWPAGNSAAARGIVALAQATGDTNLARYAARTLAAFNEPLAASPGDRPHMILALAEYLDANFPQSELHVRNNAREPDVLQAKAMLSVDKLQPGREFRIAVLIEIEPDWHIYANPSSRPEFPPATIELTSDLPLTVLRTRYPPPRSIPGIGGTDGIDVYQGRTMIFLRARLDESATLGSSELSLALRYQACNDQRCLAPKIHRIAVPVQIVSIDEPVQTLFPETFRPAPPSP